MKKGVSAFEKVRSVQETFFGDEHTFFLALGYKHNLFAMWLVSFWRY